VHAPGADDNSRPLEAFASRFAKKTESNHAASHGFSDAVRLLRRLHRIGVRKAPSLSTLSRDYGMDRRAEKLKSDDLRASSRFWCPFCERFATGMSFFGGTYYRNRHKRSCRLIRRSRKVSTDAARAPRVRVRGALRSED